jgi:hypothetical protein
MMCDFSLPCILPFYMQLTSCGSDFGKWKSALQLLCGLGLSEEASKECIKFWARYMLLNCAFSESLWNYNQPLFISQVSYYPRINMNITYSLDSTTMSNTYFFSFVTTQFDKLLNKLAKYHMALLVSWTEAAIWCTRILHAAFCFSVQKW